MNEKVNKCSLRSFCLLLDGRKLHLLPVPMSLPLYHLPYSVSLDPEIEPDSELELELALELELVSDKVESGSFTPSLDPLNFFFSIDFFFLSDFRASFSFSRSLER